MHFSSLQYALHVQATLRLFQKHLLCWKHEYIVSRNKIDTVKDTFCVSFYNWFLLKNFDTSIRSIA
jgi:hypothetical protein